MPYAAKRRLENEQKLKKEASKCKKINSFFIKSSWETRGEVCGEGDPCISASLEETGDITTTSGVTTTPEPLTLTPSSNSEKNTDNTFHSFSPAVSQPCEQFCSTSSNNTDESDSACQFQAQQNQSSHVYDRIRGLKLNANAINRNVGPGILHFFHEKRRLTESANNLKTRCMVKCLVCSDFKKEAKRYAGNNQVYLADVVRCDGKKNCKIL